MSISTNYREITRSEAISYRATFSNAWCDPIMPERQYERVVKKELEDYRMGLPVRPYVVLVECLRSLPISNPRLLDVGASSGHYSEVLKIANFPCRYVGIDVSQAFKRAAYHYFPGIHFDAGDCCHLPYGDNSFDIVVHSACIMCELDYPKAISEAARVAQKYVIFHRTPLAEKTSYYIKLGYDLEMIELAFEERELLDLFHENGLRLRSFADMDKMRTYVLEKHA